MKQNILFYFGCIVVVSTAANANDETLLINNDLFTGGDNEAIYAINVLLEAGQVFTPKVGQNDTGLSLRLTTRNGRESEWFHLYINEELYYFGQRSYILPSIKKNVGIISSIAIRVDKPDIAVSTMPYYLCIHEITYNNTTHGNCHGCAYMQPYVENKTGAHQEYLLRDANGQLI